jgi:AcrR family transcriptional regulator
MPKIIDHQQRKDQIAEAAWRIIRSQGLDSVSVRNVAEEAGLSVGSLRHDFETQSELIVYAMMLLSSRVHERIANLSYTGSPRNHIEMIIAELLPLDDVRTAEAEIWFAYAGKALTDPAIRQISQQTHQELYVGFRKMIGLLVHENLTRKGLDQEAETRRLHALVDGLVLHALTSPDKSNPQDMVRLVSLHLDELIVRGSDL